MKRCPQCDREAPDGAWLCDGCGAEFTGSEPHLQAAPLLHRPPPPRTHLGLLVALYFFALGIALAATGVPLQAFEIVWLFPIGLVGFFIPRGGSGSDSAAVILTAAAYLVYPAHAFLFFKLRRLDATIVLYALLAIILCCNVSGCRQMLQQPIFN